MHNRSDRRTFLRRTGAATSLGALALITGGAVRAQSIDSDTPDDEHDQRLREAGLRDDDTGANADRTGCCRRSGVTDSDSGAEADPVDNGRGSGVTDSDTGAQADPARRGRGSSSGRSGLTDSDSGPTADPAASGRGPTSHFRPDNSRSDTDTGPSADPARVGAVKPDGY